MTNTLEHIVYDPAGYPISIDRNATSAKDKALTLHRQRSFARTWQDLVNEGFTCLKVSVAPVLDKQQ